MSVFTVSIFVYLLELQTLGPDFVCGCLTAIDSERDPRNLMFLFTNLPYFFRTFPPGHLMEDAFDAVACYFPIDFRAVTLNESYLYQLCSTFCS